MEKILTGLCVDHLDQVFIQEEEPLGVAEIGEHITQEIRAKQAAKEEEIRLRTTALQVLNDACWKRNQALTSSLECGSALNCGDAEGGGNLHFGKNAVLRRERLKILQELRHLRPNCAWFSSKIPFGRVFDAAPDDANEAAYDALEKAYNSAFCSVSNVDFRGYKSKTQPSKSNNDESGCVHSRWLFDGEFERLLEAKTKAQEPFLVANVLKHVENFESVRTKCLEKRLHTLRNASLGDRVLHVGSKEEMHFQSLDEEKKNEYIWEKHVLQARNTGELSIFDHAKVMHANRLEKMAYLREFAQECSDFVARKSGKIVPPRDPPKLEPEEESQEQSSELPPSSSASTEAPTKPPEQPSMESTSKAKPQAAEPAKLKKKPVRIKTDHEVTSQPPDSRVSHESSISRSARRTTTKSTVAASSSRILEENKRMNRFLLMEASLVIRLLLEQGKIEDYLESHSIKDNQLVLATARQIYRQHVAAIQDAEENWKRSLLVDKSATSQLSIDNELNDESQESRQAFQNPFAQDEESGGDHWQQLMANVSIKHLQKEQTLHQVKAKEDSPVDEETDPEGWSPRCLQQFASSYERGFNVLFLGGKQQSESDDVREVTSFMRQLIREKRVHGLQLVVTSKPRLELWQDELGGTKAIVACPYWGHPSDREKLRRYLHSAACDRDAAKACVVVTTEEILIEDLLSLRSLPFQVTILDCFPRGNTQDAVERSGFLHKWSSLLTVRCRQRVLMVPHDAVAGFFDARLVMQFLIPGLFGTRRKLLAWSCAAFDDKSVEELCNCIKLMVISQEHETNENPFLQELRVATVRICTEERQMLQMLETHSAFQEPLAAMSRKRSASAIAAKDRSKASEKSTISSGSVGCGLCSKTFTKLSLLQHHLGSEHAPLGTWCCRKCGIECYTLDGRNQHEAFHDGLASDIPAPEKPKDFKSLAELSSTSTSTNGTAVEPSIKVKVPSKRSRTEGGGGRHGRSRKRITRCGRCSGCLSGDCMTCGHCKDMKKYGGPGLRKQSCKNRKCLNPRMYHDDVDIRHDYKEKDNMRVGDEPSDREDFDEEDAREDLAGSETSTEADRMHESEHSEAELHETNSSQQTDPLSQASVDDYTSSHDASSTNTRSNGSSSKAARTRVMRCGKCAGCRAPDCLKCRHCLDMKKYGGPGLRKQSCKARKCIMPKIVMLNQTKDDGNDEDGDKKGDDVVTTRHHGHDHDEDDDDDEANGGGNQSDNHSRRSSSKRGTDALLKSEPLSREQLLCYPQERDWDITKLLDFKCGLCSSPFYCQVLLDLHHKLEQMEPSKRNRMQQKVREMLLDASWHYALANAQDRKAQTSTPLKGFAKLEGPGLVFVMTQPFLVLGRLSPMWRRFYRRLGVTNLKGLPGGRVGCHVGNDEMIGYEHALIAWNDSLERFTVECLSVTCCLSVNGRELRFGDKPLELTSRSIVQIGSSFFYFLLPKITCELPNTTLLQPKEEIRAWMLAKVAKRRAQLAIDTQLALKRPKLTEP